MHIEPGVVDGAKILLSVATSAIACGLTVKACLETRKSSGTAALVQRSVIATFLVFCFFEVLWHHPVGISEVHLIMGSSLFLLFGAGHQRSVCRVGQQPAGKWRTPDYRLTTYPCDQGWGS